MKVLLHREYRSIQKLAEESHKYILKLQVCKDILPASLEKNL